jgi:hypothetical protein
MTVSSAKPALRIEAAAEDRSAVRASALSAALDGTGGRKRGRGRPLLMPPETVLEKIRHLARREEGIFRVHLTHSGLYARARRMFGSWAAALEAAGVNYQSTIEEARGRSLRARKGRAARRRVHRDT